MPTLIDPATGELIYVNDGKNGGVNPTSPENKGSSQSTERGTKEGVNSETSSKVMNQISEYIEGVIGVIPNPNYMAKRVYVVEGVGKIFSGAYYFRKVRHTIGATYTVEADVAKMENINLIMDSSSNRNRPAVPPEGANASGDNGYERIERWGVVTADSLNVRGGNPQNVGVNSSGYAVSGTANAPTIGGVSRGRRVKVGYKKGDWYNIYYGSNGGWCYARFIKLE